MTLEGARLLELHSSVSVASGVDASLTVTEKFVHLLPMAGNIEAEDIFGSHVGRLDNI